VVVGSSEADGVWPIGATRKACRAEAGIVRLSAGVADWTWYARYKSGLSPARASPRARRRICWIPAAKPSSRPGRGS